VNNRWTIICSITLTEVNKCFKSILFLLTDAFNSVNLSDVIIKYRFVNIIVGYTLF